MTYVYESIQPGLFNFTIPGEDKTVQLFKGSKVTVKQKLAGGYLRVLKLVEEVADETTEAKPAPKKATTKPKAKVEDKITKVEEKVEAPTETVEVKAEDTIAEVKEEKPAEETPKAEETTEAPVEEKPAPKRRGRRKKA